MAQWMCFRKIEELLTLQGAAQKDGRKVKAEDLSIIKEAAILAKDGKICWVGPDKNLNSAVLQEHGASRNIEEHFFRGQTVMPAFVECHTHMVFAGDRSTEFDQRIQGKSYKEIAQEGGGILATVEATRKTSKRQLVDLAKIRLDKFVRQGVTALEIKSGYALDESNEIKILEAASELKDIKIVRTFLGAHAFPQDMNAEAYKSLLLEKLIPKVAHHKLAERVDIFIEKDYFTPEFAREYLAQAKKYEFDIVAHVEQLSHSGGTSVALELGACSIDHAVEISNDEIQKIAASQVTVVLLPGADFYLNLKYPPARQLIDAGARVALATDFNPGSCPTQDLSLIGLLARLQMRMSLAEVIAAYTVGAAHALNLAGERGSLDAGKVCDFIVLDGSWQNLFYNSGHNPVAQTWRQGELLYSHK